MHLSRANSPVSSVDESFAAPQAEPVEELLQAISEALDVRDVFPRVAQLARRVLPHECLALAVYHEHGALAYQARSTPGFPDEWVDLPAFFGPFLIGEWR